VKLSDIIGPDGEFDARFAARDIAGLADDSRKVKPGYLFVAVPGTRADGLSFVPQAIAAGAVAVLAERRPDDRPEGIAFVQAKNVRRASIHASPRRLRPSPERAARPRSRPSRGRSGPRWAAKQPASAPSDW
jgi:UDP-N-acetylmuramyl tripeptide synthase